jgi:hypothetical protein
MRWPACLLLVLASAAGGQDKKEPDPQKEKPPKEKPQEKPQEKEIRLAVIVHPKNPVKNISFSELRAYLKVERQFWPNRKRCLVFLPSRKTDAYDILLKKVYRMSHNKLQKFWVRRLFSGQIPAKPSFVPSPRAAGKQVLKSLGALSIVDARQVPKGVRVLLVDGKKPADEGYALKGAPKGQP